MIAPGKLQIQNVGGLQTPDKEILLYEIDTEHDDSIVASDKNIVRAEPLTIRVTSC